MGMVAGPHGLQLIPESDIRTLRFVDELSLAFIAFTAGGKLLLGQLQRRIHAVFSVTVGLVVFEYVIGSGTVVFLAPHIEFMSEMDHLQCLAVGLMAGALVIARSPASAIAIVRELRCEKGRFTQLILGVTVIMDLVVICLFALTSLVSDALLSQTQRVGTFRCNIFVLRTRTQTLEHRYGTRSFRGSTGSVHNARPGTRCFATLDIVSTGCILYSESESMLRNYM